MPHLFLHIEQAGHFVEDLEGENFDTLDQARKRAIDGAREIMSEKVLKGIEPDGDRFLIKDEAGQLVLVVPFKDAIGPG